MSPLPGDIEAGNIGFDPVAQQAAINAQMRGEPGPAGGGVSVIPDPGASQPQGAQGMFPPGLAPALSTQSLSAGLPGHLTGGGEGTVRMPGLTDVVPNQPVHTPIDAALNLDADPGGRTRNAPPTGTDHPQQPTNLRNAYDGDGDEATSEEACFSCHFYRHNGEQGVCNAFDDYPVSGDQTCDVWARKVWSEGVREGRFSLLFGTVPGLNLSQEQDGLVWKISCKTGTLALSPGPGQVAVDKPLVLTKDLFDDMKLSFDEQAFPHITVPESHDNRPLENTGYVRAVEVLSLAQALSDPRVPDKAREVIKNDPADTHYLLCGIEFTDATAKQKALDGSLPDTSIGVKFGFRNTRTGKFFRSAFEHLALTPTPWVDGLPAFGMSQRPGQVFDQELLDQCDVYIALSQGDTLPKRDEDGTLPPNFEINSTEEQDTLHMSRTVEEVLAEEQAKREAAEQRIALLEGRLAATEAQNLSLSQQAHIESVGRKVRALNGVLPPAVLVKAKEIWLADDPTKRAESGLKLSIGSGDDATEITSASEIVDSLLAAMPGTDGQAAVNLAQITALQQNAEVLALAQAEDNTEEAKLKALDEYEKAEHPERFNPDGTRKA